MIQLYASGPTRSRRVLWALEEVGAPYEVVELRFPPRLHHPEFLAISPGGTVPALVDGSVRLTESLVICEYLSRRYDGNLTLEPDHPDYLAYLQFIHFGESTLTPPTVWARRFGGFAEAILTDARENFALRAAALAEEVSDGRSFLVAGRLTLADLSMGFILSRAIPLGLGDLLPPAVCAYRDRLEARPAYRRAYGLA